MNVTGSTLAGGTLCGAHVPLPPTTTYRATTPHPRGLDWSKHTAPVDHAAIAQARAIRRAKAAPKPKSKPAKSAIKLDVARILELAEAGLNTSQIAAEIGCAWSSARAHLEHAGVVATNGHSKRKPIPDAEKMAAEYLAGDGIRVIATRYGIARETVRRHIRGTGTPMRPSGPRQACRDSGGIVNSVAAQGVSAGFRRAERGQNGAQNGRLGARRTAPAGALTPVVPGPTTTSLPLCTGGIVAEAMLPTQTPTGSPNGGTRARQV